MKRQVWGVAGVVALVAAGGLVAAPARAVAPTDPVTVNVGRFPSEVAVDPGTHTAYVINTGNGQAHNGNGSLSIINGTNVRTMPVNGTPVAVDVNTTTHTAYVAVANDQNRLLIVSPTGIRYLAIGLAQDLAVDSADGTIWILEVPRMLVKVVGRTQTTFPVTGSSPQEVVVDSHRHAAFVISSDGQLTKVINDSVFHQGLSDAARAIAVDEQSGIVYVGHSAYFDDGVSHPALLSELSGLFLRVVDLGSVNVADVGVDPATGTVAVSEYVINGRDFGRLALVNGQRVRQRTVGGTPNGVAVDSADGAVCVATEFTGSVSIVQGTTVQNVATGLDPTAVAVDEAAGVCYVANHLDHTVTEVPMP